jgi:hypothetical protein
MKKLILLLIISFSSYSQDTIFLKNGTKIIPLAGVHKYYGTPLTSIENAKKINYAVPNSMWGKSVKSKDIDYAIAGDRLIKTFELKYGEDSKKAKCLAYYVLIETDKYRLITVTYSKDYIVPIVQTFVIDKDDAIVESAHFVAGSTKKDKKDRDEVVVMIKKYFSNIKEEMEFLEYCKSKNKYDETGIITYLQTHPYKKYE